MTSLGLPVFYRDTYIVAVPKMTVSLNSPDNPVVSVIKPFGTHIQKVDCVTTANGGFVRFRGPYGYFLPPVGYVSIVGAFPSSAFSYELDIDIGSPEQEITIEAYNQIATADVYIWLLVNNYPRNFLKSRILEEYKAIKELLRNRHGIQPNHN